MSRLSGNAADAQAQAAKAGDRRGWVAGVLALVSPLFAMLYVGRPRRAAGYFGLALLCPFGAYLAAEQGLWAAGLTWGAPLYLLYLVGAVDAYKIATGSKRRFVPRWYTTWKGLAAVAISLLVLIAGFRTFLFEPFRTPSVAMLPTLRLGDQFFVSKSAYRSRMPRRGDVIVFRLPSAGTAYVKRVIGLPGDTVLYDATNKHLTINGVGVETDAQGAYPQAEELQLARETIDGRTHAITLRPGRRMSGGTYEVPDGHYFVLGDNRDNSRDSRLRDFGFVPAASILGRATLIWWNTDEPERAGIALE
jgi:signal peptidase I